MGTAETPVTSRTAERSWFRTVADRVDTVAWTDSGRIVIATRIAFLVVAYAGVWFLAGDTNGHSSVGLLDMWSQWDSQHFLRIAERGYFAWPDYPNEIAFFPLFPLLMKALSLIGFKLALGGMIVSLLASFVAGNYLFKLAERDAPGSGRRAVLYLFLFPTAVFLIAPYSEALFLAGAIAAFYYARERRWSLVAFPAAIAMASRAAGVFLLFGLLVEFIRQKEWRLEKIAQAALSLALGLLPLMVYAVYLTNKTGSPWSFMDAQKAGWYREFTTPVKSFLATWNTWNGDYATNWVFAWRVEILGAVAGLFFVGWALKKKEWGYAAFMGITLASLMTSSWYFSIPRILLSFFPVMLFLGEWTGRRSARHEWTLLIMAPLATLGVIVFTQGLWFF